MARKRNVETWLCPAWGLTSPWPAGRRAGTWQPEETHPPHFLGEPRIGMCFVQDHIVRVRTGLPLWNTALYFPGCFPRSSLVRSVSGRRVVAREMGYLWPRPTQGEECGAPFFLLPSSVCPVPFPGPNSTPRSPFPAEPGHMETGKQLGFLCGQTFLRDVWF